VILNGKFLSYGGGVVRVIVNVDDEVVPLCPAATTLEELTANVKSAGVFLII